MKTIFNWSGYTHSEYVKALEGDSDEGCSLRIRLLRKAIADKIAYRLLGKTIPEVQLILDEYNARKETTYAGNKDTV